MAITVAGVTGSMSVTEFSSLGRRVSQAAERTCFIPTGMAVTAAAGTRMLSVASGEFYQVFTLGTNSAAATVQLDAADTQHRIDIVCAQVEWFNTDGSPKDESTAGSIVVVKGTPNASPGAPTLTQTPGVKWQQALASYLVPTSGAGFTATSSGAITNMRSMSVKGTKTAKPSSPGLITVSHGLGAVPSHVSVIPTGGWAPTNGMWLPNVVSATDSAFTIVCRYHDNTNVPTNVALEFSWHVFP